MENLPTLTKQPDLVADKTNNRPGLHEVEVLAHSALYAAVQSPLNAITQPFDGPKDLLISEPEKAKPWSLDWHMQQIGTGVGMLAPILASRKAVTSFFPSATAELAAEKGLSALTTKEASQLARYELGVSVGTGLVYGGFLTPSQLEPGQSLLDARLKQSASAGATFGTLNLAGLGLKSLGKADFLKGSTLSNVLKNDTAVLALSGVPAALVSIDSQSVLNGKGLPSISEHFSRKYAEAIYNFSIVGPGLGYLTGPKANVERDPVKPGLERAASDTALAGRSSTEMLKEMSERLGGSFRVADLRVDDVLAPQKISYERDVVDLPRLRKDAPQTASENLARFEANSIEHVSTPVRVYTAEGSSLKVLVPEEYAARLDRFAELSQKAVETDAAAAKARAELSRPELQELTNRMNVQDAFLHALMTPEPGKFSEIRLFGESNPYDAWFGARNGNKDFSSAADTVFEKGQTNWYMKNKGPLLVEDTMHEWSHLFDENHPLDAQIILIANRIDNLPMRQYAEVPREQIAILLGEHALHPAGQRVAQLMETAPVTATAIGEGLYNLLSRLPESQRGAMHEQLLARAEQMRSEAGPVARQILIEKAQANPDTADGQNALKALLFLGKPGDLQNLNGMTKANLAFEAIADTQGSRLAELPDLREADLSHTFIGVETMRNLETKPIESLNLSFTKVSNMMMSLLPKSLRQLDLSGTRIGDQAVPFLARLQRLESLDLTGTSISASALNQLRAALPKTQIYY